MTLPQNSHCVVVLLAETGLSLIACEIVFVVFTIICYFQALNKENECDMNQHSSPKDHSF